MSDLKKCQKALKAKGYDPVFIGLYGSQNYNCDTKDSDHDYKAIVMPTLDDFIFNRKPVSTTVDYENGLCDVKDIRLMFHQFKKQNPNYVEILFSKEYQFKNNNIGLLLMKNLIPMRESIARFDERAAANTMLGMMIQEWKNVFKNRPSVAEKIEKYGYDSKALYQIVRIANMLNDYSERPNKHYEEILRGRTDNKYLIDIKSYNIVYSFKEVRGLIDYYLGNRMNYYQQYNWKEKDLKTEEKLDELLTQTIKLSIQEELKKELDDFYLKNRTNYFQEHNRKEKDAKAEKKLDGLLTQVIKFSLQEGLRNEGNRR
jgi:predicted nucleotidyltransferase